MRTTSRHAFVKYRCVNEWWNVFSIPVCYGDLTTSIFHLEGVYTDLKRCLRTTRKTLRACTDMVLYSSCIPWNLLAYLIMHMPRFGLRRSIFAQLNLIDLPSHIPEKQLMIQVAELVPKHHGRTKKQEPAPNPGGSSKNTKGGKKKKWCSIIVLFFILFVTIH